MFKDGEQGNAFLEIAFQVKSSNLCVNASEKETA